MQWIRSHLSFANAISMIALFVALGGTSVAAISLTKNSVGAKQIKNNAVRASEIKKNAVRGSEIKNNAVTTGKVRNGTLLQADFQAGQLPGTGPQGPQGAPGLNGAGVPLYARVQANGTLQPNVAGFPPQFKEIDPGDIVKGEAPNATGTYCFGNLGSAIRSAVVTLDNADAALADRDRVVSVAIDRGEDLGNCPASHNQARVRVHDISANAAADARFFIWIER